MRVGHNADTRRYRRRHGPSSPREVLPHHRFQRRRLPGCLPSESMPLVQWIDKLTRRARWVLVGRLLVSTLFTLVTSRTSFPSTATGLRRCTTSLPVRFQMPSLTRLLRIKRCGGVNSQRSNPAHTPFIITSSALAVTPPDAYVMSSCNYEFALCQDSASCRLLRRCRVP